MQKLEFKTTGHASWTQVSEKEFGLECIRYYTFGRDVIISSIRIYSVAIRWAPTVIGEPEHILIQSYNDQTNEWENVCEAKFEKYAENQEYHEVLFPAFTTQAIRVICDKEHEVTHSHGEQWTRPRIIPFHILDNVEILGETASDAIEPIYNYPLTKKEISPTVPKGMRLTSKQHEISYESDYFKVAFSLRRPIITHLGWDDLGLGKSKTNLFPEGSIWLNSQVNTVSGPYITDIINSTNAQYFTGEVSVKGNCVSYTNLHMNDDFSIDICFTIFEKGMSVDVIKHCYNDYTAIEADDWRFVWNAQAAITSVMSIPKTNNCRTGIIALPAVFNAPTFGTMVVNGDINGSVFQVDSWREQKVSWCGIVVGCQHDKYGFIHFKKGDYHMSFEMHTETAKPILKEGITIEQVSNDIIRNWSSGFGFRPELAGFSNNAISCNCHMSQAAQSELCVYTQPFSNGIDVNKLMEFTLELSLKGGPGYGDCRDMYIDVDPGILIAVGRVYQALHNTEWVVDMWEQIKTCIERMLDNIDDKTHLLICRSLSGNSFTKRWSSNAMDVLSFGHLDAYSNTLAYRALMNMTVIAKIIGDTDISEKCKLYAQSIKDSFEKYLVNPKTGLVCGWRSEDGEYHDYCFTFINQFAVSYGLVCEETAKNIMQVIEDKMDEIGLDYFYYGIPINLESIENKDAPTGNDYKRADGLDKYGIYLNGSLTTVFEHNYISNLIKYGYKEKAKLVCEHLKEAFGTSLLVGGLGKGSEFFTWEGRPCGYEGSLVGQYPVLPYLAIEAGFTPITDYEWWCID